MKIKIHYTLLIALCAITILSCKKDNYKPPSLTLSGKIVYKGEPILVEYNQVGYELYQYGFGKIGSLPQIIAPDGSYSALLFAGDYKLTIPNATVPFRWQQTVPGIPDSLSISITANKTLDIEVTPYYMIRTPQVATAGGKITAAFKAEQIIKDANAKNINRVVLFINKTQFVSISDNIAFTALAGAAITDPNNINLNVTIPAIVPTQNYVFARIGLQIAGLNSWVFSPVQKISF